MLRGSRWPTLGCFGIGGVRWTGHKRACRGSNVGAVVLLTVGLVGQAPRASGRVLEAESLILRDKAGVARAKLEMKGNNSVALELADAKGRMHVRLGVRADGHSSVELFDEDAVGAQATLSMGVDGRSDLTLMSRQKENMASLSLGSSGGRPQMFLASVDIERSATLGVNSEGRAGLWLSGVGGAVLADVVVLEGPDAIAAVRLLDPARATRVVLLSETNGPSGLYLRDQARNPRAVFSMDRTGLPALVLLDPSGRPTWGAP